MTPFRRDTEGVRFVRFRGEEAHPYGVAAKHGVVCRLLDHPAEYLASLIHRKSA